MFRASIETFIRERLDAKLDKLADDDPRRDALIQQHQPATWLADAARRAGQIQAVTHSLKPIHPDARGSNLYCPPDTLPRHAEIGTHALAGDFTGDVVGNAAALDVYKFLKRDVDGRPLLDWMLDEDADLAAALHPDPDQSRDWIAAFTGLTRPREGGHASHTHAKQLYWLAGDDPLDDEQFRILAPLYATSLAHAVFQTLNEDRFGETAKQARQARRDKQAHPVGYREYPHLAVQKLGGTKPQNISQLNSERGGNNYLLASLPPPPWKSELQLLPSKGQGSIFDVWSKNLDVWMPAGELKRFLASNPGKTMDTRDARDELSDRIIDMVLAFSAAVQKHSPGWTAEAGIALDPDEQLWLDPHRGESDLAFREQWRRFDWPRRVCDRFGQWLNTEIRKRVKLGEDESAVQRHWASELAHHPDWLFELDQWKRWLDDLEKRERAEGVRP
ncbi:type I-F CRISPR-associated protein Csy1 [Luteimonas huabeiensis]|uniref:type I-F CRISPR-associated protein Csy1 n=1 Tax=Luteimonas huabeiensis TaxID=1244513 RepID=UPI0005B9F5A6|nr:type I-F CRISPR-associated protein Csy1 [Luteimonas huabeiensis]